MRTLPNELSNFAAIAARDLRVLWHPCTQVKDHETLPPIAIKRGASVWLEDYDGKRYLDAISEAEMDLMVQVAADGIDVATCD